MTDREKPAGITDEEMERSFGLANAIIDFNVSRRLESPWQWFRSLFFPSLSLLPPFPPKPGVDSPKSAGVKVPDDLAFRAACIAHGATPGCRGNLLAEDGRQIPGQHSASCKALANLLAHFAMAEIERAKWYEKAREVRETINRDASAS